MGRIRQVPFRVPAVPSHRNGECMQSLYQWLQETKGYTWAEAEETIDRYDSGMPLPDNVRRDIREYTEEFIQKYHG